MPSDKRVIAFRPDEKEQAIIDAIREKNGGAATQAIAYALRRIAEVENITIISVTKD